MKKYKIEFTSTELSTLFNLVLNEIDSGDYYGNKDQYYTRLNKIRDKMQELFSGHNT